MSTANISDLTATPVAVGKTPSSLRQTWWLVRLNLFLARRRVMSKVLGGLLVAFFLVIVGFIALAHVSISAAPTTCPPRAVRCPSPDQLAAMRQEQLHALSSVVTFPTSLGLAGGYVQFMGVLTMCIMVGALVGGEYGFGTHRLSLPRGLSRLQVLAGQVIAVAVMALLITVGTLLLGTVTGLTLGPALGGTVQGLTLEGARELVFYGLTLTLHLIGYALIALLFATLGRSAAAGIAGAIGYLFLEFVLVNIVFPLVSQLVTGDIAEKLAHVPDWLPGPNFGALVRQAGDAPVPYTGSPALDLAHAALVSLGYFTLCIVGSFLLFRTRDITD